MDIKILDKYPGPFGTSTNPNTPNQLKELEQKIRQGYTGAELGTLNYHTFAAIPKQIWEEAARLARINNVKLTLHAPVQDFQITGIIQNTYNPFYHKELGRYKLFNVLQVAGEMANIYGQNILVNVHAGEVTSAEWEKEWEMKVKNYLRSNRQAFNEIKNKLVKLGILSPQEAQSIDSPDKLPSWVFSKAASVLMTTADGTYGNIEVIPATEYYDPVTGSYKIKTVVDVLYEQNLQQWRSILGNLYSSIAETKNILTNIASEAGKALYDPSKVGIFYTAYNLVERRITELENFFNAVFTILKKRGNIPENKLQELQKNLQEVKRLRQTLENVKRELSNLQQIALTKPVEEYRKYAQYVFKSLIEKPYYEIEKFSQQINELGKLTMEGYIPKLLSPVAEEAPKLASQTIKEAYQKYFEYIKQKHPDWLKDPDKLEKVIPALVIEESYAGFVGTRPDEWIKFIEESRKALKEIIEKDPNLKKTITQKYGSVENFVNERIGATFDIGHIKMFMKRGYSEKDILEWLKQIKPYIKHIHITEANYGEDVHLLPGMSWEEITKLELEELKDLLTEKGVYAVYEPGGWYSGQFFQEYGGELPYILEYGGFSPYANLSYSEALFKPEYFMSWPVLYNPFHTPNIQVTQYSPFYGQTFSQLPPHLGGKMAQTFSGRKLE